LCIILITAYIYSKDGEKKTTPKKFNRNTSAPYRKPQGGRGGRRYTCPVYVPVVIILEYTSELLIIVKKFSEI